MLDLTVILERPPLPPTKEETEASALTPLSRTRAAWVYRHPRLDHKADALSFFRSAAVPYRGEKDQEGDEADDDGAMMLNNPPPPSPPLCFSLGRGCGRGSFMCPVGTMGYTTPGRGERPRRFVSFVLFFVLWADALLPSPPLLVSVPGAPQPSYVSSNDSSYLSHARYQVIHHKVLVAEQEIVEPHNGEGTRQKEKGGCVCFPPPPRLF